MVFGEFGFACGIIDFMEVDGGDDAFDGEDGAFFDFVPAAGDFFGGVETGKLDRPVVVFAEVSEALGGEAVGQHGPPVFGFGAADGGINLAAVEGEFGVDDEADHLGRDPVAVFGFGVFVPIGIGLGAEFFWAFGEDVHHGSEGLGTRGCGACGGGGCGAEALLKLFDLGFEGGVFGAEACDLGLGVGGLSGVGCRGLCGDNTREC